MLFRSPPPTRLAVPAIAALALGAAACTSTTTDIIDDSDTSSVALSIKPAEFIGDVPCSAAPGAMRSYVATLTDHSVSEFCGDAICQSYETAGGCPADCGDSGECGDLTCNDDEKDSRLENGNQNPKFCLADCGGVPPAFTHPSSLPTPCSMGVRFDNIAAGHRYSLQIDAYDKSADEIGPTGWSAPDGDGFAINYKALRSGSRHMHDQAGAAVTARWLTSCGEDEQSRTIAAATGTTPITGCVPFEFKGAEAMVEVSPQDALGTLVCAGSAAGGQPSVASFDLLPQDGLPGLLGVPCLPEPLVQTYTGSGVVPGATLDFFIDAHAVSGGPVVWGASCSALVQDGLTVRAACSPLSDRGSLQVEIAALLETYGVKCSGDITSYDAALPLDDTGEVTLTQKGIDCTKDISFGPLDPGDYTADVVVYAKDTIEIFHATCTGTVQPGRAVSAVCASAPSP